MGTKKAAHLSPRYGIAEWYGTDIRALSPSRRKEFAKVSLREGQKDVPLCPFLGAVLPGALCNKAGGVCSTRSYEKAGARFAKPTNDPVATLCPLRFLEDASILRWVGEVILGTRSPWLVKEVPFLEKLSTTGADDEKNAHKAGRIDWVLVDPTSKNLPWCALETQAVYFSGDSMASEFKAYATADDQRPLFPTGKRRPDYRSSGPKRLAPQLQVKVPTLGNWGRKIAVVVDRYFYENMSALTEVEIRGGDEQDKLDNSEVIWFVVDYDSKSSKLIHVKHIFSKLNESVSALNATQPISKKQFEKELKALLDDESKLGSKVFKLGK